MSSTLPTKQQLEFLNWEIGVFFHFGIRTFYEGHRDWDGKPMPLDGFNPTILDCEKWIQTVKATGGKYAILVCKHHDGFANWPSKYTEYGVHNTPWKEGKGDVVQEFVTACRNHDIKVGLYYSPAEMGYTERSPKEHDDYFINQIGELLTHYGKIDYLWFDGCGSEGHQYDEARIIKAIRTMQPEILIFNMWDPDVRWVGNEGGIAHFNNSNLVTMLDISVMTDEVNSLSEQKFLPAECDFMIRDNWFYSEYDTDHVKSLEELMGIYYYSVGRGANFLINIGPDRRGLLPEVDASRLIEFGNEVRRKFANPIETTVELTDNGFCITLDKARLINHVILREDLTKGEHIEEFEIAVKAPVLHQSAVVHIGKTIGHKRIIQFPVVEAAQVLIRITKCSGEYELLLPEVYYCN
ncbi:alpha-L-fucosidase [Paenibacillus glycanilyticus]|uniref:alpha-L-fucosidase n=1 Tax=Paenibacillus glycanilyticus TaxID=126569 RepID=UPI003EBEDD11